MAFPLSQHATELKKMFRKASSSKKGDSPFATEPFGQGKIV
jgi:hypothetical protein